MADVRDAIEGFQEDRPDATAVLRTVLAVDSEADTWEFEDIDIGTGVFGELVSRGIVEQHDGGYRLADRAAVEAVVTGDATTQGTPNDGNTTADRSSLKPLRLPTMSKRPLAGAALAVCFVVAVRLTSLPAVYQRNYVVLLSNDAYFYRYWLFDFVTATRSPLTVSDGMRIGEPLLVATLQLITALLGGTSGVADQVLAWYPVAAAVGSAVAVYWVANRLTDDYRIAVASVVFLAVIPAHGYRTALGFADHHAFDFLILGLTFASVVTFENAEVTAVSDLRRRRVWPWIVLAGVGIAAHVLAWNAGALLLVPLAVLAAGRALTVVKHRASAAMMGPLFLSTALGGGLAYAGHTVLGWQTSNMIIPPLLLAGGVVLLTAVAAVARWQGLGQTPALIGIVVSGMALLVGSVLLLPEFGTELTQQISRQFINDERTIAETQSLFNTDFGFIVAPLGYFGLSIFFAIPVFIWAAWFGWTENRGDWLTLSAYAWVPFILSLFQVRFAGHLALPTAVGTGFAFIWLTAKVSDFEVPRVGGTEESAENHSWNRINQNDTSDTDDRDLKAMVSVLIAIFLLVGGLGAVMTPARTTVLTHEQSAVAATAAMDTYATEQNLTWPDNYVFSGWGDNRMYNAFISGESQGYGYAKSNFEEFLTSTDHSEWYQRLQGRAGFIVVAEIEELQNAPDATIYAQLQREWGIDTHYRVLSAADDGRKAFAIVPGTVVNGSAPGETVTVSGTMEFNNRTQEVSTTVPVENGTYSVRISTPGTYTVGDQTVTVTEDDVHPSS